MKGADESAVINKVHGFRAMISREVATIGGELTLGSSSVKGFSPAVPWMNVLTTRPCEARSLSVKQGTWKERCALILPT